MVMIVLIVIVSLFVGIGVVGTIINDGFGEGLLAGVILSAIGALVLFFINGGLSLIPGEEQVETTKHELRALSTGSEVSGSFFLGSGTVDGKRVLNYIREEDDGAVVVESVNASGVKIYEDESTSPYLQIDVTTNTNHFFTYWDEYYAAEKRIEFHIPEGSVVENYEVSNG